MRKEILYRNIWDSSVRSVRGFEIPAYAGTIEGWGWQNGQDGRFGLLLIFNTILDTHPRLREGDIFARE
jgi:hypothetical protein